MGRSCVWRVYRCCVNGPAVTNWCRREERAFLGLRNRGYWVYFTVTSFTMMMDHKNFNLNKKQFNLVEVNERKLTRSIVFFIFSDEANHIKSLFKSFFFEIIIVIAILRHWQYVFESVIMIISHMERTISSRFYLFYIVYGSRPHFRIYKL